MLTLSVMKNIKLQSRPLIQRIFGHIGLTPSYTFPLTRTIPVLEGRENLITDKPVIFAMNHTDRYNYWPFQYRIWKDYNMFTATWVKGKYYNHFGNRAFLMATNNIPVPSRGYIITADALKVLGKPPSEQAYRILREAIDDCQPDLGQIKARAIDANVWHEIEPILTKPRDILDIGFGGSAENYVQKMTDVFRQMMDEFIALNHKAFVLGLRVLVFPEGTRSVQLQPGRTGLAQMALRLGATVIPIGCNNSDLAYPTNNPFSRGGVITYRVGKPLTPEGDLAPFTIDEPYTPFTKETELKFGDKFRGMTDLIMARIAELLDERHLHATPGEGCTTGSERFL